MAIEDFEWEGQIEQTDPARVRVATVASPPAAAAAAAGAAPSWLAKLRGSVWVEPVLRLGGMALLLAVLAGIGVVATTYAKPGLALPVGAPGLAAALGTGWLKGGPAAEPARAAAAHAVTTLETTVIEARAPAEAAATEAGAAPVPSEPAPGGAVSGITADGKVILNVASADELTKLPGVGAKRAQAIVALRTKLKRFKHPTDLLRVKGIGPRGLQRMLPHLVLDAPSVS